MATKVAWNNSYWFDQEHDEEDNTDFNKCTHTTINEDGICEECGVVMEEKINYTAEWKNYGGGDKTTKNTIQRCHQSKTPTKGNIDALFIGKDIPKFVQNKIEQLYDQIRNDKTIRSNNRTSIVAACYYYVYVCIDFEQYKTDEEVQELFGIDSESFSTGITEFLLVHKQYSKININPTYLFKRYLYLLNIDDSHRPNLIKFYESLPKNNKELNSCQMNSIAVGIIYYYVTTKNLTKTDKDSKTAKKTKKEFSDLTHLSEITITKVVNIINKIVGNK